MINFGIDLGTTNSAIAKFIKGEVQVFNNPADYGRNTLPSVVAFKKDKIFVGTGAKTYYEKDSKSVAALFKRKMGTSESFRIRAINESKSPIELSSLVLKELKTFLPPGEQLNAAVITVPASFDIIQSNATKEAGLQAGFRQVILLQEPIAASLAWANLKKESEITDGQWLVYDLGGGTFDVALIRIKEGEMNVIDHEGNNFLGGADIDNLIVEKILVPKLNEKYQFENLEKELKSASGKYNSKYYTLLHAAESAKIELSSRTAAEIVIDNMVDDNGEDVDMEVTLTRSEFNALIQDMADSTVTMIKTILTRNTLVAGDIQFVLMVGGSTYIPFIRQYVEEALQIAVNCNIDATTAIAIGAAHYAATKPVQLEAAPESKTATRISIKASWQKASREKEEIFSAKVTGDIQDLSYRIIREDKGFDSGLKKLTERINEDLPLVDNAFNTFRFTVYDQLNNIVDTHFSSFSINSGFTISGQPLPEDICLEIDEEESEGDTKLLLIFKKNSILPIKRTLSRVLNRTIVKGSADTIRINILSGPEHALPAANKSIGYIGISGKQLTRDIARGSDIELSFTISESQDLMVAAYFVMADQEFKQTFNPKERHIPIRELKTEIRDLRSKLDEELTIATNTENYEAAGELSRLVKEMEQVAGDASDLTDDDITDKRYQLEDRKRKLAQAIDNATRDKRLNAAKAKYAKTKSKCEEALGYHGNDYERKHYNDIVSQEEIFLQSTNAARINEKEDELSTIYWTIMWRTPSFLLNLFEMLSRDSMRMNDQVLAKALMDSGRKAIEESNWPRLREVDSALYNLLPHSMQKNVTFKIGF